MTAAEFLARFPRVRQNHPGDWHVPCPAHDDNAQDPQKFSLHVSLNAAGDRLLIRCFAGCDEAVVLARLALTIRDLFLVDNGYAGAPPPTPAPTPTLRAFAEKKRLDVSLLLACEWSETPEGLRIPYKDRDGSTWRIRYRTSLEAGQGFLWDGQKGRAPIPYGRWRLDEALDRGELWLVEGESDCVTAWAHQLPCLGLPGNLAAKALAAEDLVGIAQLWIVEEPGQSGRGFLTSLRARLRTLEYAGAASILHFAEKDLSEAHIAHGDQLNGLIWASQTAARNLWADDPPLPAEPRVPPQTAPVVPGAGPFAEPAGQFLARVFPPSRSTSRPCSPPRAPAGSAAKRSSARPTTPSPRPSPSSSAAPSAAASPSPAPAASSSSRKKTAPAVPTCACAPSSAATASTPTTPSSRPTSTSASASPSGPASASTTPPGSPASTPSWSPSPLTSSTSTSSASCRRRISTSPTRRPPSPTPLTAPAAPTAASSASCTTTAKARACASAADPGTRRLLRPLRLGRAVRLPRAHRP